MYTVFSWNKVFYILNSEIHVRMWITNAIKNFIFFIHRDSQKKQVNEIWSCKTDQAYLYLAKSWYFNNLEMFDLGLFLTGLKRGEFRENLCVSGIFGSYQIIPWPFWVEPQLQWKTRCATAFLTFNRILHSWLWKKKNRLFF